MYYIIGETYKGMRVFITVAYSLKEAMIKRDHAEGRAFIRVRIIKK